MSGYRLIGTSPLISCSIADQHENPGVIERCERWHVIRFKGLAVHNVYLSPHSSRERRDLLLAMAVAIEQFDETNHAVIGDFNLAPRPEDDVFGDQP